MRRAVLTIAARQHGFTLVELLVVIGIIALLIALLMPSLSVARQAAQRTACAAKLQQIVIAAQLQAMDHRGFYPLAGVLPGYIPADLDDAYSAHYDYLPNSEPGFPLMLAPITFSLARELSHRGIMNYGDNNHLGAEETDDQGMIKHFLCPSQASSTSEIVQQSMLYSCRPGSTYELIAYMEAQSYNFNEAICGWDDVDQLNRLKGRASQIHQPTVTMLAADGLMSSITTSRVPWAGNPPVGMATWYNLVGHAPITLADALTGAGGKAAGPENFDRIRHRGKINIGFCDGHVETRVINSKDLANVYLMAP